jgi:hypothetical protein
MSSGSGIHISKQNLEFSLKDISLPPGGTEKEIKQTVKSLVRFIRTFPGKNYVKRRRSKKYSGLKFPKNLIFSSNRIANTSVISQEIESVFNSDNIGRKLSRNVAQLKKKFSSLLNRYPQDPDIHALYALFLYRESLTFQDRFNANNIALKEITVALFNKGLSPHNLEIFVLIYNSQLNLWKPKALRAVKRANDYNEKIKKLKKKLIERVELVDSMLLESDGTSFRKMYSISSYLYKESITEDKIKEALKDLLVGGVSDVRLENSINRIYLSAQVAMILSKVPIFGELLNHTLESLPEEVPVNASDNYLFAVLQKRMVIADIMYIALKNSEKTEAELKSEVFEYYQYQRETILEFIIEYEYSVNHTYQVYPFLNLATILLNRHKVFEHYSREAFKNSIKEAIEFIENAISRARKGNYIEKLQDLSFALKEILIAKNWLDETQSTKSPKSK